MDEDRSHPGVPDLHVEVSGPVDAPLVTVSGDPTSAQNAAAIARYAAGLRGLVGTSPRLRRQLDDAVDAGARDVRVDLSLVGFMDSSGLGALMAVQHRLQACDGRITIVGAAPPVRRILEITALDEVFVLEPER